MNPLELWRMWRLYKEVNIMDKKALVKLAIAAVLAAVSVAGAQYTASDTVNWSAVLAAAVAAVVAYVKQSPMAPK